MTRLASAAKEAALDAARQISGEMTRGLRVSARMSGWPASAAKTLSVTSTDTGFQWSGSDEALDWEYGTLGRPPAPAVRRYNNDTSEAEAAFVAAFEQSLKDRGVL